MQQERWRSPMALPWAFQRQMPISLRLREPCQECNYRVLRPSTRVCLSPPPLPEEGLDSPIQNQDGRSTTSAGSTQAQGVQSTSFAGILNADATIDFQDFFFAASAPQGLVPATAEFSEPVVSKGEFMLGNRQYCYLLTVTDYASRYLICFKGLENTRKAQEITVFEKLFKEYGLPSTIRLDNGVPFASPNEIYGLSSLSVWWLRLGIGIEPIKPGNAQQNGRHERMHLTLKQATTKPPAKTLL